MVASKRGAARASAGEVAEVDQELPAKATISVSRGLGEESCKQHQRHRYADENGKERIQKSSGVVRHNVVDVRCEGEIRGRQKAERANAWLRHDETASQHQRGERHRHR